MALYYDHFGEGVVNTFDRQGSWGLTTTISNPAGVLGVDTSPRYTGLLGAANLPPSPGVPSPHGFPYTPSIDPNTYGLAIAWGIDDNLKTPYSHVVDFSLTRELPHSFVVEATYTGRFARHLLQEIDLSEPLDLVDPQSHMDYFTAAQDVIEECVCRNAPRAPSQRFPTGKICFRRRPGRMAFPASPPILQPIPQPRRISTTSTIPTWATRPSHWRIWMRSVFRLVPEPVPIRLAGS